MTQRYSHDDFPFQFQAKYSGFVKLANKWCVENKLLGYFAGLYLAQALIGLVTNYNDGNKYGLSALEIKEMEKRIQKKIVDLEKTRHELLGDETVEFTNQVQSLGQAAVAQIQNQLDSLEVQVDRELEHGFVDGTEDKDSSASLISRQSTTAPSNEGVEFTYREILESDVLSKNYLVSVSLNQIKSAQLQLETGQASKGTGRDLITVSRVLEIARDLFPQVNEKHETSRHEFNDLQFNLDNIEEILKKEALESSKQRFVTSSILSTKELNKKIKYSKLAGVKIVRLLKEDSTKKIELTSNVQIAQYMMNLVNQDHREFTSKEIQDTIAQALAEPDEEETPEFPEIPSNIQEQKQESTPPPAVVTTKIMPSTEPISAPLLTEEVIDLSNKWDEVARIFKLASGCISFEDAANARIYLESCIELLHKLEEP